MTDDADPATLPLTVTADLTLTLDGAEATLHSTGERLFLEFPSLFAAVRAFRSLPSAERRRLHGVLRMADLTLEIRARHRTLAILGTGSRPGPLAHQVGLDQVQVRVGGTLSAALAGGFAGIRRRL